MPRTRGHIQAVFEPVEVTDEERRRIGSFLHAIEPLRSSSAGQVILQMPSGERVEVPEALLRVMVEAADAVAHGAGRVRMVSDQRYLTTREAADLLNVSRPHLVHLLDQEGIPYTMVGSHRRIPLDALLAYKGAKEARAREAFEELFALNEEVGLYQKVRERRSTGAAC